MISITASSRYVFGRKVIRKAARDIMRNLGISEDTQVSLAFVGKQKMREVANTYKHEDVALPVLAFPYNDELEGEQFLGEIIICYPQAVLLAAERQKKVDSLLIDLIDHAMKNLLRGPALH